MLFNYYARSFFFLGKVIENRVGFAQALLLRCFYSFGLNQGESPWPYFRAAHSLPASICIRERVYLRVCVCVCLCLTHALPKKKLALSRRRRQRQRQKRERERKNEKQRQRATRLNCCCLRCFCCCCCRCWHCGRSWFSALVWVSVASDLTCWHLPAFLPFFHSAALPLQSESEPKNRIWFPCRAIWRAFF